MWQTARDEESGRGDAGRRRERGSDPSSRGRDERREREEGQRRDETERPSEISAYILPDHVDGLLGENPQRLQNDRRTVAHSPILIRNSSFVATHPPSGPIPGYLTCRLARATLLFSFSPHRSSELLQARFVDRPLAGKCGTERPRQPFRLFPPSDWPNPISHKSLLNRAHPPTRSPAHSSKIVSSPSFGSSPAQIETPVFFSPTCAPGPLSYCIYLCVTDACTVIIHPHQQNGSRDNINTISPQPLFAPDRTESESVTKQCADGTPRI